MLRHLNVLLAWPLLVCSLEAQSPNQQETAGVPELISAWVAEMDQTAGAFTSAEGALTRILLNRSGSARADSVLDALEEIANSDESLNIRVLAVNKMTSGYQAGGHSGPLVQRFLRIYEGPADPAVKLGILMSIPRIEGSGRNQAIPWLREIIQKEPETLFFPTEVEEAVQTAVNLGPAGRNMVKAQLQQGKILDPRGRQQARLMGIR